MRLILFSIALYFIFSFANCDQYLKDLKQKLYVYYRLEYIIDYKICDESTINGVLNYDQKLLTALDQCERLQDFKVMKMWELFQFFSIAFLMYI